MNQILFVIVGILFIGYVQSQNTVSLMVNFGGPATCLVCGVTNYTNIGQNGEDASAYFMDPTPENSVITSIAVTTTYMYWCGSYNTFDVLINNEFVATNITNDYNCMCNACPQTITVQGINFGSNGIPGYSYGQENSIFAEASQGSMGISALTLTFTYIAGNPNPPNNTNTTTGGNNVTVSIAYNGCGYCNLCSGESYSLSNGAVDCGEGVWGDGVGVFEDPLPKGSILTQIQVITSEFFWCEAPIEANFTVGNTYIGSTGMIPYSQCGCDMCPDTLTIPSQVYANFPGYKYGHQNMFQIQVSTGIVGVRSVELMLIYTPAN